MLLHRSRQAEAAWRQAARLAFVARSQSCSWRVQSCSHWPRWLCQVVAEVIRNAETSVSASTAKTRIVDLLDTAVIPPQTFAYYSEPGGLMSKKAILRGMCGRWAFYNPPRRGGGTEPHAT